MTGPRLNLRRPPPKPAGDLFRVTAAVSFLTLPLLWAAKVILPPLGQGPCPRGAYCPAEVLGPTDPLGLVVAAAVAEFVVIGCYLALASTRRTLDLRTGLRWFPVAAAVVALAVGFFGWLMDTSSRLDEDLDLREGSSSTESAFALLLFLWLLTPVILYGVHRGDRSAVVPVVIGLAPTAVCGVLLISEHLLNPLPAIMLVVGVLTALLVRRRH
ncbi:hypothetical protein [Kribbella speibonae]|uniref:Uncharacterized protein n=1 Tax=Kribbella speibonae TaxID=1572660 RepID=A0ABY2A868_9ACTN|nr:hypothetical protein [Kribbella speibonae]TCC23616.1 hypothetical protein E0H58_17775 [Kribbella speibonae]